MSRSNFTNAKNRAGQRGFTLLEVLVAMGLLAFLSIGIYQVTTSTWDTNTKLNAESTDVTAILLSLQAVQTDLEQIYTPRLGPVPPKADAQNQEYWSDTLRSDGLRRSRFQGKNESITFVSNNNRRVEADQTQSDFLKIKWELERNPKGTYTLFRTADWNVFQYAEDKSKKGTERVALLENLSSAKFTYYRRSDKTWNDTWDSEGIYTKEEERFPILIKLKIEAPDATNNANQQAWELVIKPIMDLNYLDAAARAALKARLD